MSKKSPKGEMTARADDLLASLDGIGVPPAEVALVLAKEPAALRRDLFETLRDRAREKKAQRKPSEIASLLSPLVSPGASNKPGFIPKYVRSLFECAEVMSGEDASGTLASLFISLVSAADAERQAAKGAASLSFESLAAVDGVISAFDSALSSGVGAAELARTRVTWIPLVPEIASRAKIPISRPSAAVLLDLLAVDTHALPAAVRLSIAPIERLRVDGTPAQSPGETDPSTRPTLPDAPSVRAMLPEVEAFHESLKALLLPLSADFENRLANQSRQLERLEAARAGIARELDRESDAVRSLRDEESRLLAQARALTTKVNEKSGELLIVQSELNTYRAHHDVAISEAERREQEAVARTKREFIETQLVVLQSIRDCIAELSRTHGNERAVRQAVTNFNNLSRFLTHGKYTAPGDIAKIELPTGPGGAAA